MQIKLNIQAFVVVKQRDTDQAGLMNAKNDDQSPACQEKIVTIDKAP